METLKVPPMTSQQKELPPFAVLAAPLMHKERWISDTWTEIMAYGFFCILWHCTKIEWVWGIREKTEKGTAPSTKLPAYRSLWTCARETALTTTSNSGVLKKYIKSWLGTQIQWFFQALDAFLKITCFTELGAMSLKKIHIIVILFRNKQKLEVLTSGFSKALPHHLLLTHGQNKCVING